MIKQTAGRDALGSFAPMFAHVNDDVLFGEVWNESAISLKTKCIITVVTLMASGITDSSLEYHLRNAKNNGVTAQEIAAVITHAAMYAGIPKGWAAFRLAKEVWSGSDSSDSAKSRHASEILFPVGEENIGFAQYFVGRSYLYKLPTDLIGIYNVTFEPKCRNNWHIHRAASGGGQLLICLSGGGLFRQEGEPIRRLKEGDVVSIKPGVKHWHGADNDSWFSHLSVEIPGESASTEWLERVDYESELAAL